MPTPGAATNPTGLFSVGARHPGTAYDDYRAGDQFVPGTDDVYRTYSGGDGNLYWRAVAPISQWSFDPKAESRQNPQQVRGIFYGRCSPNRERRGSVSQEAVALVTAVQPDALPEWEAIARRLSSMPPPDTTDNATDPDYGKARLGPGK